LVTTLRGWPRGKTYVVEHQPGDASFAGAEGILTGADLIEDVHGGGSGYSR
jgi:hypothetical protein